LDRKQFERVHDMLGQSATVALIANEPWLTGQTVYRIKDDPTCVEAALASWGL